MPPKSALQTKSIEQACTEAGAKREMLLSYIEKTWIRAEARSEWLDEDIRRAHLIIELQHDFGVNDEAVPIILHLIDQLHALHRHYGTMLRDFKSEVDRSS